MSSIKIKYPLQKLTSESKNIEPIQKRLLDKFLLEGRLNGSELNALTMTVIPKIHNLCFLYCNDIIFNLSNTLRLPGN